MARPNEADRGTDRALADLERRINSVYSQAAKELQEEIDAFFKHFADQDKKMQDLIGQKRNGKEWTEKDYQQWRLNQMGRGKRLETLRDKLAERATEAKEVALAYVNDATPGIYSLNRNYTAYTIESVHPSADFTLFDEQTVKRLIVEQPDVMPYYPERLALKRGIDLAFGKQQITASVTGSILQGRSIKQISDDLQSRIVTMSRVSAIRAARTAVTAAQNAGRMDSYAAADEMWGIKSKKKWVATKDLRTRHDHGMADNQVVDYDQPFDVGGYKMMFPGDGSLGAPGHELYNCRCTVVNATDDDLEAERHMMRVKNPETGEYELVKKKSYKEWYDEKKAQYPPEKWAGMVKAGKNYQADKREYAEYREILGKKTPKTFSAFQNMKYNQPEAWQKLQEELEKKRGKKKTGLSSITTVEGIETLFRSQDWFIHGEGELSGWRSDEALSLSGLDVQSAKAVYSSYEQFFDKLPQFKNKLAAPISAKLDKTTYAECTMGFGSGLVNINKSKYSDYNRLSFRIDKAVKDGWFASKDMIMHELGHAVDDYLSVNKNFLGVSGKKTTDFVSNKIRAKILNDSGIKLRDIKSEVSEYATTNAHEWFAECFAEYMTSENPRKCAKAFGDWLEKVMADIK